MSKEAIVPQKSNEYEASIFDSQSFTEEDVLPFLLQAQDIICKLESRVVELEKDLSTIHNKYENDKDEWIIGLSQKDQYISHISSKLSKVEFNSKETILLLSELNTNDEQINSAVQLCLQYLRQGHQHIPEHSSEHTQDSLDIMDNLSSKSCNSLHTTFPSIYIQSDQQENNQCCINCKQLLAQLDDQIEQKAYLKRDLGSLAASLIEQEQVRSSIELDKEALESDVADLTTFLFSIINQILMDDVTERDAIVKINRELNGRLSKVLHGWDTRESRMKQVKEFLVQLDSTVHQSANTFPTLNRPCSQQSLVPSLNSDSRRFSSRRLSSSSQNNIIQIDGHLLSEFQHHLKAVTETSKIPLTPFVKRVFSEDIEPCLFSQKSQGWWRSSWFKKKLLNSISKNTCEIQYWNGTCYSSYMSTTTHSSSSLMSTNSLASNQSSNDPPKTKCVCCNLLRVCEFRMSLSPTKSPWLPIDRFCRDKVISVCGYYSFMNNLIMLSSATTLLSAFKQVMIHRRRISLSRVGSMSLFEDLDELLEDKRQKRYSFNRESLILNHSETDYASITSDNIYALDGPVVIVH